MNPGIKRILALQREVRGAIGRHAEAIEGK